MMNKILIGATLAFICLPALASADMLTRQLDIGATGSDVSSLQTFLSQDGNVYPQKLVTGYFGPLTAAAVGNFQALNNIVSSGTPATTGYGRVGPTTLAVLNAQMGNSTSVDSNTVFGAGKVTNLGTSQPVLSNIAIATGINSATITWNSNVNATARVMYATQWPFNYASAQSVTTSGLTTNESVTLNNLQANTTYYYVVESLDSQGNFSWSVGGPSFTTQ